MSGNDGENVPKQEGGNLPDSGPIKLMVVMSGECIFFKIKKNTKLSKLQAAFATKIGKDVKTMRFSYGGTRINDDDTPASLEMEENGTIDVMEEYTASDPGHPQDVLMADVHGSPINPNQGLSPDMSDVCGCTSLLAELLDGHP